jgi:hypothetical protein
MREEMLGPGLDFSGRLRERRGSRPVQQNKGEEEEIGIGSKQEKEERGWLSCVGKECDERRVFLQDQRGVREVTRQTTKQLSGTGVLTTILLCIGQQDCTLTCSVDILADKPIAS